jgi:membrane protein YdbS with pleckstrin-like domain
LQVPPVLWPDMALPRKFLNEDEELLAELQPHWIFLFGPLFTSIGTWAAIIAILIVWAHAPGWTNYPFLILALIPGLWLLGRFIRWRSYVIALTSTRILVRQGIFGRDTVQLRLQRITEVNISQTLIERVLGTGRLVIDVQGEDDSLTLEYVRRPAVVQRVINSQINEIVGGGRREAVPGDMLPSSSTGASESRDPAPSVRGVHDDPYGSERHRQHDPQRTYEQDTPPFGVEVQPPIAPGPAETRPSADRFEIRDRLIELDDLRRRGIISEEEFASKKSELLNRI